MGKAEKERVRQKLAGIDEIDWTSLSAVYGDAGDTPKLIRRLYKAKKYEEAAADLDDSLFHQGFITRAAIVAVPFLAEIAVDGAAPGRRAALTMLVDYAWSITAEGHRPAALGHPKMDRKAHAALAACAPELCSGLADEDQEARRDTAVVLGRVADLSADVAAALRDRLAAETDNAVLGALVGALLAHGGLSEDEASRVRARSPLARFAIAWEAVAAGGTDPDDLETLAELWNTCVPDCTGSGVAESGIEGLVSPCPESVAWLTGLALRGGTAAHHGLAGLYTFLCSRRDLAPVVLDALLHLATHLGPGFDDDSFRTPRHELALTMGAAVAVAGDRRTELLDALRLVVDGAPAHEPPSAEDFSSEGEARLFDMLIGDEDIRADALPALLGHPGSMDLLRAVLAESDEVVMVNEGPDLLSSEGPLPGELVRHVGRLTAEQTEELAAIVVEQLGRTTGSEARWWLELLVSLPDDVTRRWRDEVVARVRALSEPDEPDGYWSSAVVPILLRWRTPASAALLEEWTSRPGELSRWATLALGVLRGDAGLVDAAYVDGLPQYQENEYLALAEGFTTPRLLATCRTLVTGEAADVSHQLTSARTVAETDGLVAVWPTVLAVIDDLGELADAAISIATRLLARYPDDPAQARCRRELVSALTQIVDDGKAPYGRREIPVLAAAALLDMGEPIPTVAAKRATAMLKALSKGSVWCADALDEACRVLEAVVAGQTPTAHMNTVKNLRKLVESPVRIQGGPEPLALDEKFTARLRELIKTIDQ